MFARSSQQLLKTLERAETGGVARLYHGSPYEFVEPRLSRPGVFWLAPDLESAAGYTGGRGRVMAFDVRLGRVADLTKDRTLFARLADIYNQDPEIAEDKDRLHEPGSPTEASLLNSSNVLDELRRHGYDSAKVYEDRNTVETSYAVLDTARIRRAVGAERVPRAEALPNAHLRLRPRHRRRVGAPASRRPEDGLRVGSGSSPTTTRL